MEKSKLHTILVAEDNDSNFLLVEAILHKKYQILRANNGIEALKIFRSMAPDLILMDIKMPEMDGLTATRHIRNENPDIPIIALSAFAFDTDIQAAFDCGCTDYIVKPIALDKLRDAIQKYLEN